MGKSFFIYSCILYIQSQNMQEEASWIHLGLLEHSAGMLIPDCSKKNQNQSSVLPSSLISPPKTMPFKNSAAVLFKNHLTYWTLRSYVFRFFSTPGALEPYWCFFLLKQMITWLQELQFRGSRGHCPCPGNAGNAAPHGGSQGLPLSSPRCSVGSVPTQCFPLLGREWGLRHWSQPTSGGLQILGHTRITLESKR